MTTATKPCSSSTFSSRHSGPRPLSYATATAPALRKRPRLRAPRMEAMGITPRREAVRGARHAVNALMSRWRIGPGATFQVELIVSELLTNALRHARPGPGGEIGLQITKDDRGGVLVEVEDGGSLTSSLFTAGCLGSAADDDGDDDAEHGRGLLLVDQLCQAWGWRRLATGHHSVWAYVSRAEGRGAW
ncbi:MULTISPECIES: ATP-binding protein [Streptomyces]|uniref:ATP-binding protein n=1 Tax=Streptomyces TaxID=1883 RepID=UPI00345BEB44